MRNPFDEAEKDNIDNFPTGFYYCYTENQLVFLEKNEGLFIGTYYKILFRDAKDRVDPSNLDKLFKPLQFNDIKNDIKGFVEDVQWLINKKVYGTFVQYLLENEQYEILGFCNNVIKNPTHEKSNQKEKKKN